MPLMLNPDWPVIASCEIVMLDVPVFVSVSESVCLFPICTVPKLRLVGPAPSGLGETPTPVNSIVSVGFVPSDVMVTLPFALPVVTGANATVKVVLCEGFRARGVVIPLN